jgi:hypothetical protein
MLVHIPNMFVKMFTKFSNFKNTFAKKSGIFMKYTFSKHCHVLAVLSKLPIGRHGCFIPVVLS